MSDPGTAPPAAGLRPVFVPPDPALAPFVEAIWDVDVADGALASRLAVRVLPTVSPLLVFHHREPMHGDRQQGAAPYRHIATGIQTRAVTIRPGGAIGAVIVRLRPGAAPLLLGAEGHAFADAEVGLDALFGAAAVAALEQRLAGAGGLDERVAHVRSFLLPRLHADWADALVSRAAASLHRNPGLPAHRLARDLGVSERHLARRFQAVVGTNPKRFARVARVGAVLGARWRGGGWADIAAACGYTDQAHMVNEFRAMAGSPPEAFFRATAQAHVRPVNTTLAVSAFSNTYVT